MQAPAAYHTSITSLLMSVNTLPPRSSHLPTCICWPCFRCANGLQRNMWIASWRDWQIEHALRCWAWTNPSLVQSWHLCHYNNNFTQHAKNNAAILPSQCQHDFLLSPRTDLQIKKCLSLNSQSAWFSSQNLHWFHLSSVGLSSLRYSFSLEALIPCQNDRLELLNKIQLYKVESELGVSPTEWSTLSVNIKHYIAHISIGKLEPYPKK